jgi:hypothetical protein
VDAMFTSLTGALRWRDLPAQSLCSRASLLRVIGSIWPASTMDGPKSLANRSEWLLSSKGYPYPRNAPMDSELRRNTR